VSAASSSKFNRDYKARGGWHLSVFVEGEVRDALAALSAYHRLTRKEVISRLVLGQSLAAHTCNDIGLSPAEVEAYKRIEGHAP